MTKMEKINFVAGLVAGIVFTIIVNCSNGNKKVDNAETTTSPCVETTTSPCVETTASPYAEITASPYEEKTNNTELENAIESAEAYSNVFAYSKKELIDQLKYEGFSEEIAECAAKSINANWKENCVRSAYSYLEIISYSKEELIEQLDYVGFTPEEIDYAMDKIYK